MLSRLGVGGRSGVGVLLTMWNMERNLWKMGCLCVCARCEEESPLGSAVFAVGSAVRRGDGVGVSDVVVLVGDVRLRLLPVWLRRVAVCVWAAIVV